MILSLASVQTVPLPRLLEKGIKGTQCGVWELVAMAAVWKAHWLLVTSQGRKRLFCAMFAHRVGGRWSSSPRAELARAELAGAFCPEGWRTQALPSHTNQIPPSA